MDVERMKAKRAELQQQLETLVADANRQIAALEGAIAMLGQLIGEVESEDEAVEDGDE